MVFWIVILSPISTGGNMSYSYKDYQNEMLIDQNCFSERIVALMNTEEFMQASLNQRVDNIWNIFHIFSREYYVIIWGKCLKVGASFKWQKDIRGILDGKLSKDILVLFAEFVQAHKLPKSAMCFERIDNRLLHDAYFRCKRCKKQ